MTIKTLYEINDTVWIHGITNDNRLVKGKVIKKFTMDYQGYDNEWYYVVAVPTEIEPLLEIRTWHNISQDNKGPIGAFRNLNSKSIVDKFISKVGYKATNEEDDSDEPSSEEIIAALEKSQKGIIHQPLNLKDNKKPRRRFTKRKVKND